MIRCKCGVWTSYGLTCVNCRQDAYRSTKLPSVDDLDEPVEALDDDDEIIDEED
jgi:hypothetical protein